MQFLHDSLYLDIYLRRKWLVCTETEIEVNKKGCRIGIEPATSSEWLGFWLRPAPKKGVDTQSMKLLRQSDAFMMALICALASATKK